MCLVDDASGGTDHATDWSVNVECTECARRTWKGRNTWWNLGGGAVTRVYARAWARATRDAHACEIARALLLLWIFNHLALLLMPASETIDIPILAIPSKLSRDKCIKFLFLIDLSLHQLQFVVLKRGNNFWIYHLSIFLND